MIHLVEPKENQFRLQIRCTSSDLHFHAESLDYIKQWHKALVTLKLSHFILTIFEAKRLKRNRKKYLLQYLQIFLVRLIILNKCLHYSMKILTLCEENL